MRDNFEAGDTIQFTFTSSVAPDAAPTLVITGPHTTTPVASLTSVQSDSTHYYALYTTPTSLGLYLGEWYAQKTIVGSVYPFRSRFLFNVVQTSI